MLIHEYAKAIANEYGCRVAIVRVDKDGSPYEAVLEAKSGGFPSANGFPIVDIVSPDKEGK
jgi:hypothetical protein